MRDNQQLRRQNFSYLRQLKFWADTVKTLGGECPRQPTAGEQSARRKLASRGGGLAGLHGGCRDRHLRRSWHAFRLSITASPSSKSPPPVRSLHCCFIPLSPPPPVSVDCHRCSFISTPSRFRLLWYRLFPRLPSPPDLISITSHFYTLPDMDFYYRILPFSCRMWPWGCGLWMGHIAAAILLYRYIYFFLTDR